MAASIAGVVARIKRADDPLGVLGRGAIRRVCEGLGHEWRDRELDPATTVALFVQQVLHGNCPCSEVRHLPAAAAAGATFTPSAYCQARSRLPLAAYQSLLTRVVDAAVPPTRRPGHLWPGRHRTFHADGSTFSMPDTPELVRAFGLPGGQAQGCGFPVAHLLVLFSASTGLLLDAWASPMRTGDLAQAPEVHPHLAEGDVLVADDAFGTYAFGTYAHLALLLQAGLHGLFPVHHRRVVDFTPGRAHADPRTHAGGGKGSGPGLPRSRWLKSLGRDGHLVEWLKPDERPAWLPEAQYDALPDAITVRELRRTAERPGGAGTVVLTMVTTLLDPAPYTADALLALRLRRWDVETNLRHLKITLGLDVLRCKNEQGVRRELTVFRIAYNLVRVVMLEAARRQDVPVARVSFADALKWMRHARPGQTLPDLIVNPHRPDRAEPRCKKRRPKQYDLMNKPRDELRRRLKKQRKKA